MTYRFTLHELYADGGVIGHNPSDKGGTWAYRILEDGLVVAEDSGWVTPVEMNMLNITNNFTEMYAVIRGVEKLSKDWNGTILSDSQITLGRWFMGWKWHNIPMWMIDRHAKAKKAHTFAKDWRWILLQGHPTKAHLETGVGPKGYPVSAHNKWCDEACGKAAVQFLEAYNVDHANH